MMGGRLGCFVHSLTLALCPHHPPPPPAAGGVLQHAAERGDRAVPLGPGGVGERAGARARAGLRGMTPPPPPPPPPLAWPSSPHAPSLTPRPAPPPPQDFTNNISYTIASNYTSDAAGGAAAGVCTSAPIGAGRGALPTNATSGGLADVVSYFNRGEGADPVFDGAVDFNGARAVPSFLLGCCSCVRSLFRSSGESHPAAAPPPPAVRGIYCERWLRKCVSASRPVRSRAVVSFLFISFLTPPTHPPHPASRSAPRPAARSAALPRTTTRSRGGPSGASRTTGCRSGWRCGAPRASPPTAPTTSRARAAPAGAA